MATQTDPKWDTVLELIEKAVRDLNETLGLPVDYAEHLATGRPYVTFGYIGNCSPGGGHDDRLWMVFLPRAARMQPRHDTSLGSVHTGDVPAARHLLAQVRAAVTVARATDARATI
jgi:hypothetical protein